MRIRRHSVYRMAARRIAVDRTEIPLPVHQRIAQENGCAMRTSVSVDGRVAVGMVNAHRLTHHFGALGVFLVVLEPHLAQGVEHAPMHGLQAVAGIRQRAPDDHTHRVVEIGAAHLLFNVDRDEVRAAVGRGATFERGVGDSDRLP